MRPERPKHTGPRINDRIRVPTVRLIGAKGEQMGIVPIEDALRAAKEVGLDLVEVAPDASPPVCRLMDHGRHKFEEEKRRRESRKKEASNKLRLVRFRPNIGEHDFDVKVRKLRELLEGGEKCRVSVTFRRREMRHVDVGVRVLDRIEEQVKDIARIESRQDRLDGRDIGLTAIPLKTRAQLLREQDQPEPKRKVTGGKKARKAAAQADVDLDDDDDEVEVEVEEGADEPAPEGAEQVEQVEQVAQVEQVEQAEKASD